jgi:proline dehydrogenase
MCHTDDARITGAGQDVTEALLTSQPPPPAFLAAVDEIAEKAKLNGCRIWIDAEQQAVQGSIDVWTVDLMRKYNRGADALIYNTIQAYLKESRPKLQRQLQLASDEGWNLGIKLVRGAYIANEIRDRIHATKRATDLSYDGIVHDLLTGHFEGFTPQTLPETKLFLAGHNSSTVRKALDLAKDLAGRGKLVVSPEFGQLQGMADDLGGEIIQFGETLKAEQLASVGKASTTSTFVPRVYKCLTWGSIQECMQFLLRRAIENSAAVGRMEESIVQAKKELARRFSWRRLLDQR